MNHPHKRRCWTCQNVAIHESDITPGVLCQQCGSQDTRRVKEPTTEPAIPATFSQWRHKSGQLYTVLCVANVEADADRRDEYPPTVVYKRQSDATIWSRPLSRWHGSMTAIETSKEPAL